MCASLPHVAEKSDGELYPNLLNLTEENVRCFICSYNWAVRSEDVHLFAAALQMSNAVVDQKYHEGLGLAIYRCQAD